MRRILTNVTGLDIAEGLPDKLTCQDWVAEVQSKVITSCERKADPFLQLLKEMLDMAPEARPSAEACLSDPRLQISLEDGQFDLEQQNDSVEWGLATIIPGSPTEVIDHH